MTQESNQTRAGRTPASSARLWTSSLTGPDARDDNALHVDVDLSNQGEGENPSR